MSKPHIPQDELESALQALEAAWREGTARSGGFPGKPEYQARLTQLLQEMLAAQNFARALSRGELAQSLEAQGVMAASLKSLQTSLRHLSWQARMVAKGDFNQRVDFMGEFSDSFNQMISSLVGARDHIKRREAELLHSNANLQAHNRDITLINKLSDALQTCFTWDDAFPIIAHFLPELFPLASGVLFMQAPASEAMQTVASWGASRPANLDVMPQDCWAISHGAIYFSEEIGAEKPCCHVQCRSGGFSACLPLQAPEKTMGLLRLQVLDPLPPGEDNQFKGLAKTIKDQLSLALANISLRETLHHQAIHDPLTDLFNRRYLVETLDREILRAQRKRAPLAVMMLDLDHFKRFNDASGHEAGDNMLRTLAEFLQSSVRGGDIACRYGGEEFVLILPEVSQEVALMRAEEFRHGVAQLKVPYRGELLGPITISLGVAVYPKHGETTDDLLKAADEALYRAKAAGRNRVLAADQRPSNSTAFDAGRQRLRRRPRPSS